MSAEIIIVLVVGLLPLYVILLSACSYIGKILAIRILFYKKKGRD